MINQIIKNKLLKRLNELHRLTQIQQEVKSSNNKTIGNYRLQFMHTIGFELHTNVNNHAHITQVVEKYLINIGPYLMKHLEMLRHVDANQVLCMLWMIVFVIFHQSSPFYQEANIIEGSQLGKFVFGYLLLSKLIITISITKNKIELC